MGKVGSAAIMESLKQYKLGRSIYHIHNLHRHQAINELEWHLNKSGTSRRYDGLWHSLFLSEQITRTSLRKWHIITLVREPVGRNISGFFQVMDRLNPEFLNKNNQDEANIDAISKAFLSDNTQHSVPLSWFDNERAKVLLIRLENLDDCAQEAFKDFLEIENFKILPKNIGKDKEYKDLYKNVLKEIKLPDDYLNVMYNSKYTNHFYTRAEIS